MLLTSFCIIADSEESVADTELPYYKYVINYTNEKINSVDVYTTKGSTTHDQRITTAKDSIWNFNSDGYGPFNSCYAAVEASTGTIKYHMNPNDLTKTIDGQSITLSDYNIVWLIPTVYWGVSGNTLILCSEKESGLEAYMHTTTNGGNTVWKYVGIGVYEASTATVGSIANCLMSQSGKTPTASKTIETFDSYGQNTPGNAILWNFYQWTFLKMATYMVGMGKNTQQIWGAGKTGSSNPAPATTGLGDNAGPYVSSQTSYSKVFVENSWGSVSEWVGSTVFEERQLYTERTTAASSSYTATIGKDQSGVSLPNTSSSKYWIIGTSKSAQYWDLPTSSSSTSNSSNTSVPGDFIYSYIYDGVRVVCVGGTWSNNANAGVAYAHANNISSQSYTYVGGRLAYYFDTDSAAIQKFNVTISSNSNYLTISGSSFEVTDGESITVSGNTLSYGSTIITATPSSAQYEFSGWTVNGSPITGTYTPTSDIMITANVTLKMITVSFYKGTSGNLTLLDTQSIAYGTSPTLFTPSSSALNGQVFVGWFEDVSHTQQFNPSTTLTSDTPLYCYSVDALQFSTSPVANATFDNIISLGMMVFDATASESAHHILWDFGDGQTSTEKIAYHIYQNPGTYNVKLSVYNSLGELDTQEYQVAVAGDAPLHADDTLLYVGASIAAIIALFAITKIF